MSDTKPTTQPGIVAGIATTTSKVILAHYEKALTAVLAVLLINGQAWLNVLPTPPVVQPKAIEKVLPDPRVAGLEKTVSEQAVQIEALRAALQSQKSPVRPKSVSAPSAK